MAEPTPSVRERIVRAAVAQLGAAGQPAGASVHRGRRVPLDADALPAYVPWLEEEEVTYPTGEIDPLVVLRTAVLVVEVRAAAAMTDAYDGTLDPYVTWAVEAISADPTFGGLAHKTLERHTAWGAAPADQVYAAAQVRFTVEYQTLPTTPTSVD